jgi:hypothetical protein
MFVKVPPPTVKCCEPENIPLYLNGATMGCHSIQQEVVRWRAYKADSGFSVVEADVNSASTWGPSSMAGGK